MVIMQDVGFVEKGIVSLAACNRRRQDFLEAVWLSGLYAYAVLV